MQLCVINLKRRFKIITPYTTLMGDAIKQSHVPHEAALSLKILKNALQFFKILLEQCRSMKINQN